MFKAFSRVAALDNEQRDEGFPPLNLFRVSLLVTPLFAC
jgi:hypothetical protein